MGENQTNKVLDDKLFLTNAQKAEALMKNYGISKKYTGDRKTFLKVMFGKGGVIRLLSDNMQTSEKSYFSTLATIVHNAYIKCKFENSVKKNEENINELEEQAKEIGEAIKKIDFEKLSEEGYNFANEIRKLESEINKMRAMTIVLTGVPLTLALTGVGTAIVAPLATLAFTAHLAKVGKAKSAKDAARDKKITAFDNINKLVNDMKNCIKKSNVEWGKCEDSLSKFFDICVQQGTKYCSQKKITFLSRKIDKVKFNVADILKNINNIKFSDVG